MEKKFVDLRSFNFYISKENVKYYNDFITTFKGFIQESEFSKLEEISKTLDIRYSEKTEIEDINNIGIDLLFILNSIFPDSVVFEKGNPLCDYDDIENVQKYKFFGETHCKSVVCHKSPSIRPELFENMLSEIYRNLKYVNLESDLITENGELEFLIRNKSITGKIYFENELIFEYLCYLNDVDLEQGVTILNNIIDSSFEHENEIRKNEGEEL